MEMRSNPVHIIILKGKYRIYIIIISYHKTQSSSSFPAN